MVYIIFVCFTPNLFPLKKKKWWKKCSIDGNGYKNVMKVLHAMCFVNQCCKGRCSPIRWGSCGTAKALLSSLSSTQDRRKNFYIVDRKRQLRFPRKSSACAGCGFLREWVQAPSSWPTLLSGHISPPACSSPLSHPAPVTFSILPWTILNSFCSLSAANSPFSGQTCSASRL